MRNFLFSILIIFMASCSSISPAPGSFITPLEAQNDFVVLERDNRPNFVFILVDDLDLLLGTINHMPILKQEIIDKGLSIENFFISTPICCPSRVTFLKGQYAHNHQVFTNNLPGGGFPKFAELQSESSTIATWLQGAGYHTSFLGKYMNAYPIAKNRGYIPPGWNDWVSPVNGKPYTGLNYTLNVNGEFVDYDDAAEDYISDVLTNYAVEIIERESQSRNPFFMQISYYAPHEPFTPALRHEQLFAELQAPRTPSFNEDDVSDKPGGIRFDPQFTANEIGEIDHAFRQRVRAMQSVDEAIAEIVGALDASGLLENTYLIFTSDNGFHLGQHRDAEGKGLPYEEDIRVPFFIRGPEIMEGKVEADFLASNVDFAPTIAELAGIQPPDYLDGLSLVPLLLGSADLQEGLKRDAVLIEFYGFNSEEAAALLVYGALRTREYTYIEYFEDNFIEVYDLVNDPYQLDNIANQVSDDFLDFFSNWLHSLLDCAGDECNQLDDRE